MWPELRAGWSARGCARPASRASTTQPTSSAALDGVATGTTESRGLLPRDRADELRRHPPARPNTCAAAYDLCHEHDVPTVVDEIQSCIWSPELFLFREYGLQPTSCPIGKGFPGGEYPASRILCDGRWTTSCPVRRARDERPGGAGLAGLPRHHGVRRSQRDYGARWATLTRHGSRTWQPNFRKSSRRWKANAISASLRFRTADCAVALRQGSHAAGYDVSAQTYKANCPPTLLIKLPIISSYRMVDQFVARIVRASARRDVVGRSESCRDSMLDAAYKFGGAP